VNIPIEIAAALPPVAAAMEKNEQKVIDFCRSKEFSVDKLREVIKTVS